MSVFLTGATGFVGRRLLSRPELRAEGDLVALARRPLDDPRARWVAGDLRDPAAWRDSLRGCRTVVHLAARTGAGSPTEHEEINDAAVRRLLVEAERAGVRRFLLVSTIAATYPEKRHYPYARAKERAEAAVRASTLDWAILRPTIVLGPGSPVGASLRSLAGAPFLPLLGGGRAILQPVHVDDVAAAIGALLAEEHWEGRIVDLGGPAAPTFAEFLRAVRIEVRGTPGPAIPIPVRPLVAVLGTWERLGGPRLPVTAGQFYAFLHDGVAREGGDARPPLAERRGLAAMVAELGAGDEPRRRIVSPFPPPPQEGTPGDGPAPPVDPDAVLDAECATFTRYLIGAEPSAYARTKYREGHRPGIGGPADLPPSPDDRLVEFARRGPLATRIADTWAGLFARGGRLRRKLVLLLAILESDGATSARVDSPEPGGAVGFGLRTALRGAGFLVSLAVAALAVGLRPRKGGS
jgi:nucleoside-diphosphate-sugar epimerase